MINVLYYYYYLFYTKILPDNQPHATVVFTLGFTFSLILNLIINIGLAYLMNISLGRWAMIGVFIFVLFIFYLRYYRNGKGKNIIIEKPKILNSNKASIIFSVFFFILGILALFLQADITRIILSE
jgi:hypothetical protein